MTFTAADQKLIRVIQARVGVDPTGELDRVTLLAIDEVLGIAHKFFTRLSGTDRNNFPAAAVTGSSREITPSEPHQE
jgi:hypothetical protein